MIKRDPKDYTDMGVGAIEANIAHYCEKMAEAESKFDQYECEKIFWESVKELKNVL